MYQRKKSTTTLEARAGIEILFVYFLEELKTKRNLSNTFLPVAVSINGKLDKRIIWFYSAQSRKNQTKKVQADIYIAKGASKANVSYTSIGCHKG